MQINGNFFTIEVHCKCLCYRDSLSSVLLQKCIANGFDIELHLLRECIANSFTIENHYKIFC